MRVSESRVGSVREHALRHHQQRRAGGGTIFKISTDGTATRRFTGSPTRLTVMPPMRIGAVRRNALCTTTIGGTNSKGAIFAITPRCQLHPLAQLCRRAGRNNSFGGLVLNAGILYGSTLRAEPTTTGHLCHQHQRGDYRFSTTSRLCHQHRPVIFQRNAHVQWRVSLWHDQQRRHRSRRHAVSAQHQRFEFAVLHSFTNNAATGSDPEKGVARLGDSLWGTTYQGGVGFGVITGWCCRSYRSRRVSR